MCADFVSRGRMPLPAVVHRGQPRRRHLRLVQPHRLRLRPPLPLRPHPGERGGRLCRPGQPGVWLHRGVRLPRRVRPGPVRGRGEGGQAHEDGVGVRHVRAVGAAGPAQMRP